MYGRSRKGARSYRGSGSRNYRKPYGSMLKAAPYTGRRGTYMKPKAPRFAVAGYLKDTEKKYTDAVLVGSNWITQIISYEATPGVPASAVVQGVKFMSNLKGASGTNASQNLVSGVPVGVEANKRIGNKVYAKWLDLGITLEAAKSPVQQYGEQVNVEGGVATAQYYMKTNFRIVIVKDKQVNNTTNTVLWGEVFGLGLDGIDSGTFASNDKLDIPNMGRFEVVKDVRCTVDAESPLKTLQMGCVPGSIRYNSGVAGALTNKGYYLLIGQDVLGTATSASFVIAGNVRGMTTLLSVNEFWKKARELLVALWNRTQKSGVQWMERDWAWDEGIRDLARLCRSDQEQSRFKWMQERALGLINRTRMTISDYDDWPKVKLNAEGKAHFMKAVRDMNEDSWNYSKRSDAIARIANYWIRKGEDEEDVSGWLSEQIHKDWDLSFKYEDWKFGEF